MAVALNGNDLSIEQTVAIARRKEKALLAGEAKKSVTKSREYVETILAGGEPVYGLTTGFGSFQDKYVPAHDAAALQSNLIKSHSCGTGEPLPEETVRAMLALRINALAKGYSGIRLSTLDCLVEMLNRGVVPVVPEKGSLGASGDLVQLAHMVLPVIGEGEAYYEGVRMRGKDAMARAGVCLVQLEPKEGLALINGTQVMCAIGALALHDVTEMARAADVLAAMCCEAQLGIKQAFDSKIQDVRNHPGQRDVASNLRRLLEGSRLAAETGGVRTQDAYTVRCTPQIHGGVREALRYVRELMSREINAATDNPLIFADEDAVISGGNFHGQPVAIALDTLGIAASVIAGVSERRTERLVNPALSNGLPAFLCREGGLNSGLMILQYSAASLVSENKIYAHPASVDSIPSSANQEDYVSMGTTAARTAGMIAGNTKSVLAIELFAECQALSLRGEELLAPATKAVYDSVRAAGVPVVGDDIVMYPIIEQCEKMIAAGEVIAAAESVCGRLL